MNATKPVLDLVPSPGRPGRPRRFSPDAERQLLLDAAMVVMRRSGSAEPNVTEVLDEAGLSTRAFYRHFPAKDDLLRALQRREGERASERLVARVAAADTPLAQLEAWVDEMLSFVYDRRKAVRVALLSSDAARRVTDATDRRLVRERMAAPLIALLEGGRRSGAFPAADPERHAHSIGALMTGVLQAGSAGAAIWPSRSRALAEVVAFCLPALGVPSVRAGHRPDAKGARG